MTEKQQMMSEHVGNWWPRFECYILNTKEVRSSNKFEKHWSARVTDEFSSKTLILWKRLSSLDTKCVQFLPCPSLLFHTCYAGEMMIPCQVSTFSEFVLLWFTDSRSFSSLNKLVNDWIQQMMSERVGNWWNRFECCIMPAQKKSGVQIR